MRCLHIRLSCVQLQRQPICGFLLAVLRASFSFETENGKREGKTGRQRHSIGGGGALICAVQVPHNKAFGGAEEGGARADTAQQKGEKM